MNERDIFIAALQKQSTADRQVCLDEACHGNTALRQRIEVLLQVHERAGGFLEPPANGISDPSREREEIGSARPHCAQGVGDEGIDPDADHAIAERPGTVIGPYKLLEQIGEGGFGVVFIAEQQEPIRRKVAVKVIKPGMDTRQVIARFEAERQALALMDHPNIARVLDAGTTESRLPFFVMELVKALPITEYCDQNHVPVRKRLELFVSVCHAVQHAHQKGIIHRDIKPCNVMITLHDGTPVVKVIDFGIAKAIDQKLTDKTLFTNYAQMIGTPLYMSPEQAGLSGLDVDTRSDVYALGVLLYELLTGTTPFDRGRFKEAGFDEIRRIIREEEPPRPSTRLSETWKVQRTALSAENTTDNGRGVPRAALRAYRFQELDWIVMKALEKDRSRRYESASALAADLERYLRDEPVLACPPSALYRFRKLARQHRWALLTVGLVMAALVAGSVASAWQALRATQAQGLAQERLETAESNLLLARQAVDEMYTKVADDLAVQPHLQPFQRDILEKALGFYQEFARRSSGDPIARRETARAWYRVGNIQWNLGRRRQAKQACDEAITMLEELAAELPRESERRVTLAHAYQLRARILTSGARLRDAEKCYRQALVLHADLVAEDPTNLQWRSNLAAAHQYLGSVVTDRPGEAEKAFRTALTLYEELAAGPRDQARYRMGIAGCYLALGGFLANLGRSTEAGRAFQQTMDLLDQPGGSPYRSAGRRTRSDAEFELGRTLADRRKWDAAEAAYRRAIAAGERLIDLVPDLPDYQHQMAVRYGTLASLLADTGKADQAALFRHKARELLEKVEIEFLDDRQLYHFLGSARTFLRDVGDLEAAERFSRRALAVAAKLAQECTDEPALDQTLASSHMHLGTVLQRRGRAREAADQFRQGLVLQERLAGQFPEESSYRHIHARLLNFLGIALRDQPSEAATALDCHQKALQLCDKLVAEFPDQPLFRRERARSFFARGTVLNITGRHGEAIKAFQQAVAASPLPNYVSQFASIHNEWAWLLATCPKTEFRDAARAVTLASRAVELAPEQPGFWNTLGVAHYRAGHWQDSNTALEKSMQLFGGRDESFNTFFLAMSQWKLNEKEPARKSYDQAVRWMEKNQPRNEELRRFRAEANELLGITQKKD
jgi:serine/threonine protein kinase/Flp pilus assembly protein TadD